MKKELLFSITKKDFTIQTFCSGGPGGQHQNKVATGVRITHNASGAVGESREHKSQLQNKKAALKRLVESVKFRQWHYRVCQELISGETIEQKVDEQMKPENIKIEEKDEKGRWVEKCNKN